MRLFINLVVVYALCLGYTFDTHTAGKPALPLTPDEQALQAFKAIYRPNDYGRGTPRSIVEHGWMDALVTSIQHGDEEGLANALQSIEKIAPKFAKILEYYLNTFKSKSGNQLQFVERVRDRITTYMTAKDEEDVKRVNPAGVALLRTTTSSQELQSVGQGLPVSVQDSDEQAEGQDISSSAMAPVTQTIPENLQLWSDLDKALGKDKIDVSELSKIIQAATYPLTSLELARHALSTLRSKKLTAACEQLANQLWQVYVNQPSPGVQQWEDLLTPYKPKPPTPPFLSLIGE